MDRTLQPNLPLHVRPVTIQRFSSTEIHVAIYIIERLCQELWRQRTTLLGVCFTPNTNSFLFEVRYIYCPTAPSLAEYFIKRIRLEPNAINTPPSRKVQTVVLEQNTNLLQHLVFIVLSRCQCPLDDKTKIRRKQHFQNLVKQGEMCVFYCFMLFYTKMLTSQATISFYSYLFSFLLKKTPQN